jgi:hypothetical protein
LGAILGANFFPPTDAATLLGAAFGWLLFPALVLSPIESGRKNHD